MLAKPLLGSPAPEFSGIKGWLNSPPLTILSLNGKVVFLDFWTYSCVNCVRSLPHMKGLHERYSKDGLVLVGVHTPEFEFEKAPQNVADAVRRFQIVYPVAIDSDNATWKLYGNQYWPRQTLIDASGRIRWEHAGEGDYDKMEEQVRSLLGENGTTVSKEKNQIEKKETSRLGIFGTAKISPEVYAGALRSPGFGNGQVCVPGSCTRYIDPGEHQQNFVYLEGDWTQFPEYIVHAAKPDGHVLLRYSARNANAVLGTSSNEPVKVKIQLDGKPARREYAGSDLRSSGDEAFIEVNEHRLYEIIKTGKPETHELKLVTDSDSLRVYTFTFG